jgi:hypothetical protein
VTHPLITITRDLDEEITTLVGETRERTSSNGRHTNGNHGAPPINTSQVDLQQWLRWILTLAVTLTRAANTGDPARTIDPWLGIHCTGSCRGKGALVYDLGDTSSFPIVCTYPDCRDDQGIATRYSLQWLKGEGDRLLASGGWGEPESTMIDRLKARIGELERMLDAADRRTERATIRAELAEQQLANLAHHASTGD